MKEIFFVVLFGLTCRLPLYAQTVSKHQSSKKALISKRTAEIITINGLLNEESWDSVKVGLGFKQIEPDPGEDAKFKTEVKSLYNDQYLYFGIICHDTAGRNKFKVPDLKRDFAFQNHDLVGITIDGFNDRRNSMTFFVNPYGAQRDYLSFDDTYFDVAWDGLWRVNTTRTDEFWIAEFAIPWKTLRYKINGDKQPYFGLNVQRVRRTSNERSAWSVYPRSVGFNRMQYAGVITGFNPPKPATNILVNPHSLLTNDPESPASISIKAGGEVKWALNPNLVFDATVNTDFAQADVDQLVNNLTRFSVLLPEKRQFFLENASLFGVGITGSENSPSGNISLIPFFSRRIGLDENNRPVPLDYGGRMVYRSAERNTGTMFIQQRGVDRNPRQRFFVGRYSENIGRYSRVGIITTAQRTVPTDTSNSFLTHTTAVDGFFRLNAENLLKGMVAYAGGTTRKNGDWAGYVQYQYNNSRVNAWLTSVIITENFDPSAGFVSRRNVISATPGAELNLRGKWMPIQKKIRAYVPSLRGEFYHQASTGILQEQTIEVAPLAFNLINGGEIKGSYSHHYQNILTGFRPLGITISKGKYTYSRYRFAFSSDASRKLSYDVSYETGGYFNGNLNSIDASVAFSPNPYVSVEAGINRNDFKEVGTTAVDKTVNLYTLNSRLALNPQLQLTLSYQKNSLDDSSSYNGRFSWEYKPLSFIYLVFNRREFDVFKRQPEQNSIVKINFLKQF